MNVLASLSPRGKAILAGCAMAFIVVAVLLVRMASAPSYTEVMAGLDPAQTGKITTALDAKGIAYELRSNGTALAVEKAQVGPARIALATEGLNGAGNAQPGFELLDKQKLGASSFQQQVAYQRALEGQIANTIGQIDGVSGATVSLTLPKDQLFADEQKPATAAVLLGGSATTVEPGAVRGIANLVASSVQGLKTSSVTITDASGQMLWPQGDAADGGSETSKPAAEARYNAQLTSSLDAMLVNTLGPDKAHVVVRSDLNVDRITQDKMEYAKKGVPLKATDDTETLKGEGGGAKGGAAGTASNIPAYAATSGSSSGKSDYKHTTKSTDFGVDKTVSHTLVAPGTVHRLDVSVLVDDKAVPAKSPQLTSLTAAVSAAAGIQKGRDTLAVTPVAFAKQPAAAAPAAGPLPAGVLGYAKTALIALAALAFLFFVSRQVRKRESDAFAHEPSWLRQLQLPGGTAALGAGGPATEKMATYDSQAAARALFQHDPKAMALEELVKSEPEKVAHQLRTWITEDGA